jgi:hypothetical protein
MKAKERECLTLKEIFKVIKTHLIEENWKMSISEFQELTGDPEEPEYFVHQITASGDSHKIHVFLKINPFVSSTEVLVEASFESNDKVQKEYSISETSENPETVQIFLDSVHDIYDQYLTKISTLMIDS